MGNELIITTVPSESLMQERLYVPGKDGQPVRLADLYPDRNEWFRVRSELRERHPDAFYMVPVPLSAVWDPPGEPYKAKGAKWIPAHRRAMTKSLLNFLNKQLAGLDQMLRTGSFVIERARVRAVSIKPIPEYAWKRFARDMKKSGFMRDPKKPNEPTAKDSKR